MHNYINEEIDSIKELLPSTYTEEEKNEIVLLLIDLAKIYSNAGFI